MTTDLYSTLAVSLTILLVGLTFLTFWHLNRRRDYSLHVQQLEHDARRIAAEDQARHAIEMRELRREDERAKREDDRARREDEEAVRTSAGAGTGGFIFIDLPEDQRLLFHDLLNGFKEFARLKGYQISFSIDATFPDRIAFKFTIHDEDGISVGPQRVRKDFKEYIARVQNGDNLEDVPVVISIDEHELLVAALRNRLSFLQHTYRLQQNALAFYEQLFDRYGSVAALPAPSVVVQTGGSMDSQTYSAVRSSRLLQGDHNSIEDGSSNIDVRIGQSFNERAEQVAGLQKLMTLVQGESGLGEEHRRLVATDLSKVLDELERERQPSPTRIKRWLAQAKTVVDLGKLGTEASSVAKSVFESFGM